MIFKSVTKVFFWKFVKKFLSRCEFLRKTVTFVELYFVQSHQMADPGEFIAVSSTGLDSLSKIQEFREIVIAFLKYPQVSVANLLMKELNLCAHDHSFVPPW